jgi:hypothetical protein
MNEAELRTRLAGWHNLGPLRELDDLRREMAVAAEAMTDFNADVVAATLVALDREGDRPALDALCDFLEFFTHSHPHALGAALLARLQPDGPPVLVEQIGATHHPDAARLLGERLNLQAASEPLLIALASTLGELRGGDADALLETVAALDSLPTSVRDEIAIARQARRSTR